MGEERYQLSWGESRALRSRAIAREDVCTYGGRETRIAKLRNNNGHDAKFDFSDVVVVRVRSRAGVIPSRISRKKFQVMPKSYDFRETVRVVAQLIGQGQKDLCTSTLLLKRPALVPMSKCRMAFRKTSSSRESDFPTLTP